MIRVTYKHVFDLPTSISHAKKLDKINSNTLWINTINREMEDLKVSFEILECRAKILVGCNKASGHLVFDVRMTLERKYR